WQDRTRARILPPSANQPRHLSHLLFPFDPEPRTQTPLPKHLKRACPRPHLKITTAGHLHHHHHRGISSWRCSSLTTIDRAAHLGWSSSAADFPLPGRCCPPDGLLDSITPDQFPPSIAKKVDLLLCAPRGHKQRRPRELAEVVQTFYPDLCPRAYLATRSISNQTLHRFHCVLLLIPLG
ncbi:hypothetical protein L249_2983, partial [Ophiocordyceps polyrhachis-furcata BCC 54312]